MCGGGGDGGAQAEANRVRAEESQREYQIAQDVARINALFGQTEYDYTNLPDLQYFTGGKLKTVTDPISTLTDYQSEVDRLTKLIAEDPGGGQTPGDSDASAGLTGPTGPTWEEQLASLQAEYSGVADLLGTYDPTALSSDAATAASTREATLKGVYDDIMNKYNYEMDTQFGRKQADVTAMLAGRGLESSTVGQTTMDRLGQIYDTNEANFEQNASNTVSKIKQSDVATLADLVRNIEAGGNYDTAKSTALSSMTNAVDLNSQEAYGRDLTNLFKGMDELYGQKQYVDQYNAGQNRATSNVVTPGSSGTYSGQVLNY